MILYLDTSALVKLYVREAGAARVKTRVGQAPVVATSRVAYPEARAAFARRHHEGALAAADLARIAGDLDRDFGALAVIELAESLARSAGDLAERHALRGFDAIHLASALELGRLVGEPPLFLAFDARLAAAAALAGLRPG
ncbi:MAG: type II toxin-antitoxin system VapC family toxin [Deltaproteobacteria bacterium]|nr:type II toxin-antitoxin system VapC family toxin [Deltaproteobacteria bacterium]